MLHNNDSPALNHKDDELNIKNNNNSSNARICDANINSSISSYCLWWFFADFLQELSNLVELNCILRVYQSSGVKMDYNLYCMADEGSLLIKCISENNELTKLFYG